MVRSWNLMKNQHLVHLWWYHLMLSDYEEDI